MEAIPKWIRHVNGMSTSRDLLNDMYHILRLRCGSFQNEPDMSSKSIIKAARAMKSGMEANNLYRHYVEIGMLSHLLYSSLGLQLGYKVICILFRSLSNIISLIWQATAVLYLLRIVLKLQHMQQKQTFMAGQDDMSTLLASKYTNSSQSIVRHKEQILEKPTGSNCNM